MDPERNEGAKAQSAGPNAAATVAPQEPATTPDPPAGPKPRRTRPKAGTHPNNVKKLRQRAMMSKAELARRAGVSPLTIDRVESGCPCRMDTKRKILEALGLQPAAAPEVFPSVDLD